MDWAAFDALTDEEIAAAAATDSDNPIISPEQLARMRRIAAARFIRQKLSMSQKVFAEAYGIPLETLVAWERHESEPTPAELAYLRAIERHPDVVRLEIPA